MKNQYFGNIHDYHKYGLLRALQAGAEARLLVAWMLTPDEEGGAGGSRSYLSEPDVWKQNDPELFTALQSLLRPSVKPAVALIEESGLLPGASFYRAPVSDSLRERNVWRQGLLEAAAGVDLVFLDPDYGIEVPSNPVGKLGSSRYVAWKDIRGVWDAGSSVLVYQHFPRERRAAFADRSVGKLREQTLARFTAAVGTPDVLFLLAGQPRHEARLQEALAGLQERWGERLEVMRMGSA